MAKWLEIASCNELPLDTHKTIYIEGVALIVCNIDGRFYAIEDRCSHMDFPLSDGFFEKGEVTCLHHGARFCIKTGEALCAPAFDAISTFEVRVVENKIEVLI